MLTVLIGPPGAGKSTLGFITARLTSRPFIDADESGTESYARVGWSVDRLLHRASEIGFEAAHVEWEPALARAVIDLVAENRDAVIALGAGHSHVTNPEVFDSIALALAAADQVVLLRPDPDSRQSLSELRERCRSTKGHEWIVEGVDWLHRWLHDGRDEQLATSTVYTSGLTVDEAAIAVQAALLRLHRTNKLRRQPHTHRVRISAVDD